ncbi:MAG: glycosyltransferase family 2 protein [Magnetococcales bacterium]|nr:glycosyltransferase family 2 protein [Magnetococcales bacterium]
MSRVNVVIPVHNMASTLQRAVTSVRAQIFTDWTLTLVDDASTDDSMAVATGLARTDARIHVLRHAVNKGPAAARNTGGHAVESEYLAFLDADDTYDPVFLEETVRFLDQEQALDAVKVGVTVPIPVEPEKLAAIRGSLVTNMVLRRVVFRFLDGFPEDEVFRGPLGGEDVAFNYLLSAPFAVGELPGAYYHHHIEAGDASHTTRFLRRSSVTEGKLHLEGDPQLRENERLIGARISRLVAVRNLKLRLFVRRLMHRVA